MERTFYKFHLKTCVPLTFHKRSQARPAEARPAPPRSGPVPAIHVPPTVPGALLCDVKYMCVLCCHDRSVSPTLSHVGKPSSVPGEKGTGRGGRVPCPCLMQSLWPDPGAHPRPHPTGTRRGRRWKSARTARIPALTRRCGLLPPWGSISSGFSTGRSRHLPAAFSAGTWGGRRAQ